MEYREELHEVTVERVLYSHSVRQWTKGTWSSGVLQSAPLHAPNSLCAFHKSTVWTPVGTAENDKMQTQPLKWLPEDFSWDRTHTKSIVY